MMNRTKTRSAIFQIAYRTGRSIYTGDCFYFVTTAQEKR